MRSSRRTAVAAAVLLACGTVANAAILKPAITSCLSSFSPVAPGSQQLNISDVYAQLVGEAEATRLSLTGGGHDVLRIDLIGSVGSAIEGYSNVTNKLTTLFTDTNVGGISVYSSATWLCNSIFPATLPQPYYPFNTTYCPLPAGPLAINVSVPLYRSYALTTLSTRIRIVDTSAAANTLSCVDVQFTPYDADGWYYDLLLWLPVAIAAGSWGVTWAARFTAGWVIGRGMAEYGTKEGVRVKDEGTKREARMRKWGTMIVSGLSGERLSVSAGLLRFVTPSLRDIIYHIQFCTILGMVAVQWPSFAYPILARGAWSDLVWNTTFVSRLAQPLNAYPQQATLPSSFSSMMTNPYYPIYLNNTAFNPLLDIDGSMDGMASFAAAVGLRPQDLFGTCLIVFLLLAAGIILVHVALWAIHAASEYLTMKKPVVGQNARNARSSWHGSQDANSLGKELDTPGADDYSRSQLSLGRPGKSMETTRSHGGSGLSKSRRTWLRFRIKGEAGAFHAAALYGNLLRLVMMFHLPITAFSTYQLYLMSEATILSRVFAALALVVISLTIPAGVMLKVYRTPTGKLYDATRTLLSLGPLYNVYTEEKQMFRVFPIAASLITGVVIGAGQQSGIAQAVILVLVELAMLIIPAIWYPWGEGASMGAVNAFLGFIRTVSVLLVMVLSPVLDITQGPSDWIAYAVLLLQAIAFGFFLCMLLTKLTEGIIRLSGGVHFDESNHPLDGGLFAAIADLDCLNPITGGKAAARKRRKRGSRQLQRNVSAQGSLTTQMMLDRHSVGVQRALSDGAPSAFMSPYQTPGAIGGRFDEGSYFPASPPLGPPPIERHSSDMAGEDSSAGHIMDAWQPPAAPSGYAPSGGYHPPSISSPVRQTASPHAQSFALLHGRPADSGYVNPYASGPGRLPPPPVTRALSPVDGRRPRSASIEVTVDRPLSPPAGRPVRPAHGHTRQRSSTAILDSTSPDRTPHHSPPQSPPQSPPFSRMHSSELMPPTMPIQKRRSLNDMGEVSDSPPSDFSDSSAAERKKGKRRSGGAWRIVGGGGGSSNGGHKAASRSDSEESEAEHDRRKAKRSSKQSAVFGKTVSPPLSPRPRQSPGLWPVRPDQVRSPGPSAAEAAAAVAALPPPTFQRMQVESEDESDRDSRLRGGWRVALGLTKKKKAGDMTAAARDEVRARKVALAKESGALFAGVEAKSAGEKSFRVRRPQGPMPGPSSAAPRGQPETDKLLGMTPASTPGGSMAVVPTLGSMAQGQAPGRPRADTASSFVVKRVGQTPSPVKPGALPIATMMSTRKAAWFGDDSEGAGSSKSPPGQASASASSAPVPAPTPAFKVNRPQQYVPPTSGDPSSTVAPSGTISGPTQNAAGRSFVVKRPARSTPSEAPLSSSSPEPELRSPLDVLAAGGPGSGYGPSSFRPLGAADTPRSSLDSQAPTRPPRNPRRDSQDSVRLSYERNRGA